VTVVPSTRYRILEQIGRGGMGVVYRARDTHLERDVALKVLPQGSLADEAARRRFRKEALALSQLNHPNVATVHDFETRDGVDCLVMEFVPGVALDRRIAEDGPLEEREVLRIGLQAAAGLEAAHARGVIHRDFKPHNLVVTPDGRVKVLDFGLARSLRSDAVPAIAITRTEAAGAVGTLAYLAPEVLGGEPASERSDLYSLGVVLYEMATGRLPFSGDTALSFMYAILNQTPAAPATLDPRLSTGLSAAILRALDRDPARRHASVRELASDLERLVASASAPAGAGARPRAIESIAVLPLENLSGDPAHEFFADGMTEALIAGLAKLGGLRVISRTSAMRYKGARRPLPEIARELRVDAVLEGAVVRSGGRVRVSAQLIRAATDEHLWAESYERALDDVLALQSELARTIAVQVQGTLTPQAAARLGESRSVDPAAYDAYLKGRQQWYRRTPESVFRAVEHLRRALDREPEWALAHAALADAYDLLGFFSYLSPGEAFPAATAAATRALELDPHLGEAHVSLAYARHYYDWDWAAAEASFRRGIELNPGYALGHQWYMNLLTSRGRFDEARAEVAKGRELDPLSPVMVGARVWVEYYAREYASGLEHYQASIALDPRLPPIRLYAGWSLECLERFDEAIEVFEEAILHGGRPPVLLLSLARVHAKLGHGARARRLLEEAQLAAELGYLDPFLTALVWSALGDADRAFEALERAYLDRSHWLVFVDLDPRLDELRADPRFAGLARRVEAGGRVG
jgi:eukaryotic-like serine/threonine-protein kinase